MELVEESQAKVSNHWVKYWKKYYKSIPQQGLNNRSVNWRHRADALSKEERMKGIPTLRGRLKKIDLGGWMNATKLPYMYFSGSRITDMIVHKKTREDALPEVKRYTILILKRLERLIVNMDTVTVLSAEELEYWKERVRKTRFKIIDQSAWVGLAQEVEFKVVDIPEIDYSPLGRVMDTTLAYTTKEVDDMLDTDHTSDMLWKAWENGVVDKRTIEGTVYWARKPTSLALSVNP